MKKVVSKASNSLKKKIKKLMKECESSNQVDPHSFNFVWKTIFSRLPNVEILDAASLSNNEMLDMLNCCLLSRIVYKDRKKRYLPKCLSNIVYENVDTDYFKIPYIVVNSDELDTIFVACRGSACIKDFIVDFIACTLTYHGGKVHEGVFLTAYNLYNSVLPVILELTRIHNNRRVVFTGHSLGGGVAAMLAEMFNSNNSDIKASCTCFAPVASFTKNLWEISRSYITSYIVDGDFVPYISHNNAINLPKNTFPKPIRNKLNAAIQVKMNRHSKELENLHIFEVEPVKVDFPDAVYPPGNSFLIKMVDEKYATIEVQKITNNCTYFGQFVKELNEFRHQMKIYKSWTIKYFIDHMQDNPDLIEYYDFNKKNRSKTDPVESLYIESKY